MENNNNNNNNNNSISKKKTYNKIFWSISSILFAGLLIVGGIFAYKLFANSKSVNNDTISKDTLLFKQTDIVPFKDKFENNRWTEEEFIPFYESLSLRTFTQSNLTVDGNSIRNLIDEVYPLSKSKIQINLNEHSNLKYLMSTDVSRDLSYISNNSLYLDSLDVDFIQGIRLTKLNTLYSAIDNYINNSERKFTISEFQKDVIDNNLDLKRLISDNLYISDSEKINPNDILKVEFDKNNNFTIELNNADVKYYIDVKDEYENVSLNDNILTIWNLRYYKTEIINESNLSNLKNSIQNFINKIGNKFSLSQFQEQINSNTFKAEIAGDLNINQTSIGDIEYQNNVLKISPSTRVKFKVDSNNDLINNLMDSDGNIRISNLTFYDSISLYELDKLYNAVNDYINESKNKFTISEFKDELRYDKNYSYIENLILTNLRTSSSSTLSKDKLQDISLDGLNRLVITLKTDYTKYSIATPTQNVYFENDANTNNSKLIVNNLQYYNDVPISDVNLNNLQQKIQDYIKLNKLTKQQFVSEISKLSFKTIIMSSLGITNIDYIGNINFDDVSEILEINPSNRNKFSSSSNSSLIVNNNIQVSGFKFFTQTNITNLDKLWDSVNSYITDSSRKLTSDEFRKNLIDDNDTIKTIVANNIDTILNNAKSIDKTKITELLLNNNNELEITLDNEFVKYQLSSTNYNVSLNGNKLIAKNLKFYNAINIASDKLNNLENNIQNYIDNQKRQYTEDQFINQINSNDFRNEIIKYLGVNNGDVVNSINYNNGILTITPTDNQNNRNKFTSSNNSSLIVNNNIEVSNFKFFNVTTLSNTDKLTDAINTIITSNDNKFTVDEFKNYITSNLSSLKDKIASNIDISWNEKLDSNKIQKLEINDLNQLVISLDPTYAKYELFSKNSNIELVNNQLFIDNLTFYTEIKVSDENLENIHKSIQKYIKDNSIMDGSFNVDSEELINLISTVKTEDNKNLASFIKESVIENNNVKFILKDLVKISSKNLNNIVVSENSIQINNLEFLPSDNYFTWDIDNQTKITGLTDLGNSQTKIVIPEKATEISDSVFYGNKKIEEIDLSKSKITIIPDGWAGDGLFYGCSNLKKVILPSNLTFIGKSAFMGCSSLTSIKLSTTPEEVNNELPSTLTTIGDQAFRDCSSLNEITLPSSVTSIGKSSFNGSGLVNIVVPKTVTTIGQNSFQNCKLLETAKILSPITTIGAYTFANCPKLTKVSISNTITNIDYYAFKDSSNVILEVPNQAMKDKFDKENILSLNSNKIIVNNSLDTTLFIHNLKLMMNKNKQ